MQIEKILEILLKLPKVINKQLKTLIDLKFIYLAENLKIKKKFYRIIILVIWSRYLIKEFNTAKERIFYYASMADKFIAIFTTLH